jgi:hypothetical protein
VGFSSDRVECDTLRFTRLFQPVSKKHRLYQRRFCGETGRRALFVPNAARTCLVNITSRRCPRP